MPHSTLRPGMPAQVADSSASAISPSNAAMPAARSEPLVSRTAARAGRRTRPAYAMARERVVERDGVSSEGDERIGKGVAAVERLVHCGGACVIDAAGARRTIGVRRGQIRRSSCGGARYHVTVVVR